MSAPGPPGAGAPMHSLPAKPPAPKKSTPANFGGAGRTQPFMPFQRNIASPAGSGGNNSGWNTPQPNAGYGWQPPPTAALQQNPYQMQPGPHPGGYSSTPPQISNPFPVPNGVPRDPEYEAQIAQWQSAYVSKDDPLTNNTTNAGKNMATSRAQAANKGSVEATPTTVTSENGGTKAAGKKNKHVTVVRSGGGKTWHDDKLLEWDPAHFRLFVGNLAGEVTDESLFKAFSKYKSLQKARVVRDQRTTKSKGYGFVSFSLGDDYFSAFRDMNGKYIGSHPVQIKPAKAIVAPSVVGNDKGKSKKASKDEPQNKSGKGEIKNKDSGQSKSAEAGGHANTGAGVKKNKAKGSLRLLG